MLPILASNSTQTGTTFAALAPTATEPATTTTDLVIPWDDGKHDSLLLNFFGRNADNLTMKARVTGYSKGADGLFQPMTLCEMTATFSTSLVGVSGKTPSDSDLMADTITVDKGVGVVNASPADDTGIASVIVPIGPFNLVRIQMIRNGSATQVNGLYVPMDRH